MRFILPGKRVVYLGPLKLFQSEISRFSQAAAGVWWSQSTAGLVGGIAGAVCGVVGGIIGTLAGLGIARKVYLSLIGIADGWPCGAGLCSDL